MRQIKVLISRKLSDQEEEEEAISKTIRVVIALINKWKEVKLIDNTLDFEGYHVDTKTTDVRD